MVQADLHTADQTVGSRDRNDNSGGALIEFYRPLPIVIEIEAGDTLHGISGPEQTLGEQPAHGSRRCAAQLELFDLRIRESPDLVKVFPVGIGQ